MPIKKPAQIRDRPCGFGKTSSMIENLSKHKKYLIIVPYLSEVTRVLEKAAELGVEMVEPTTNSQGMIELGEYELTNDKTKRNHLYALVKHGRNICTTHAMYPKLSEAAMKGVFKGYEVIIDEVVETVKPLSHNPSKGTWDLMYLQDGYVEVDAATGQVTPTEKWNDNYKDITDVMPTEIYLAAKSGTLYVHQSNTLVWALPRQLLDAGDSLTVYTYLSKGSLMVAYLDRVGLPYEIDSLPTIDNEYLIKAKELLTVKLLKNLAKTSNKGTKPEFKFSYNGQSKMSYDYAAKVAQTLNNLAKRDLREVKREDILITCTKANWFEGSRSFEDCKGTRYAAKTGRFSKGSGLFNAQWVPNTTRGTNKFNKCSHVIYLYDQFTSPNVMHWLGMKNNWQDHYALSEAVQLIWRSRIREGRPVTVYFASQRMFDLFNTWLSSVEVDRSSTSLASATNEEQENYMVIEAA